MPKQKLKQFGGGTTEQIALFSGMIQIQQKVYKVKMHKNLENFTVWYRRKGGNEANTSSSFQKKSVEDTVLISNEMGYGIMTQHEYKYDRICGYVLYKHLFKGKDFSKKESTGSKKFNKVIKTELQNSKKKQNVFNIKTMVSSSQVSNGQSQGNRNRKLKLGKNAQVQSQASGEKVYQVKLQEIDSEREDYRQEGATQKIDY